MLTAPTTPGPHGLIPHAQIWLVAWALAITAGCASAPAETAADSAAADASSAVDVTTGADSAAGLFDTDAGCEPTGLEVCDGVDNDCDGLTDNGACTDDNPCTVGVCKPGAGCVFEPTWVVCDDGDPCTLKDFCQQGQCRGDPKHCDDNNPCTDDRCSAGGACEHPGREGSCTDGDACTGGDTCVAGACKGNPLTCDDGNPCTNDACGSTTGCVFAALGGACDDGDPCTEGDTCDAGTCVGKLACDDGNPCTADGCLAGAGCVSMPTSASCTDGDACTMDDHCVAGACTGTDKPCDDKDPCTLDTCDGGAGTCQHTKKSCDDGMGCTWDQCQPSVGCVHIPLNGKPCTDGALCGAPAVCQGAACVPTKVPCDDGNGCTADSCGAGATCLHQALDGALCDDGNACTQKDACAGSVCKGVAKSCDDNNPCTDDTCKPDLGCTHTPGNGPCSDGNPCTLGDACSQGVCIAGDEGHVSTIAGDGIQGSKDGVGTKARLHGKLRLAADRKGGVFVLETWPDRIRHVDADGVVTTVAGMKETPKPGTFEDGPIASATFTHTQDLAHAPNGDLLVLQRTCVRRVRPGVGVTMVAGAKAYDDTGVVDGPGTQARFDFPRRIAFDPWGNRLLVVGGGSLVRVVTPQGAVHSYAATAFGSTWKGSLPLWTKVWEALPQPGGGALLVGTFGLVTLTRSDRLSDWRLFAEKPTTGKLPTAASAYHVDGYPDIAALPDGRVVLPGKKGTQIHAYANGTVSHLVGSTKGFQDGPLSKAHFFAIDDLVVDSFGDLIVADGQHRLRRVRLSGGSCHIAGRCWANGTPNPGNGCEHCQGLLQGKSWSSLNDGAECDDGNPCTKGSTCTKGSCVAAKVHATLTPVVVGKPVGDKCEFIGPTGKAFTAYAPYRAARGPNGLLMWTRGFGAHLYTATRTGQVTETLLKSCGFGAGNDCIDGARDVAVDQAGTGVLITDYSANSLKHLGKGAKITTVAGNGKSGLDDGAGSAAQFATPTAMRWGNDGRLYVLDQGNQSLRIVDAKGKVSTWRPYVGGKSAIPTGGDFDVDADGRVLALYAKSAIKLLTPDGKSTQINQTQFPGTVDGPIASAQFDGVTAVAFAPSGGILVGGPTGVRLVLDGQVSTLKPTLLDGAKPLAHVYGLRRLRDNSFIVTQPHACRVDILELSGGSCYDAGACVDTGTARSGSPCTTCQPSVSLLGLSQVAAGQPCSDGDLCTTGDVCSQSKSCAGKAIACDDKDPSTLDVCSKVHGGCHHT